jgi:Ca-activated chloride channel family protein
MKLEELAREAGASARTVRYYVQRGLLPAPTFRGKATAYSREHLVRLRAIRRLREEYYPLEAILAALDSRSLEEIELLAEGDERLHRQKEEAPPSMLPEEPTARTFTRVSLAPGLELSVAADASAATRRLAEKIMRLVDETHATKARERER